MQPYRLDDLELGAWRGFLRVHAALMKELDAELQSEHGLTLSSYEVLLTLAGAPERQMRMSEVADSVLLSRSGLTRLCDRLERDGLIERQECPSDRRGFLAHLTDAGRERFETAQHTHLAGVHRSFLGRLSADDLRRLADVWDAVVPGAAGPG